MKFIFRITILIFIVNFVSCKSEYTKYVESEMNKSLVNDSLIFGLKIGQTKKEFFTHCWDLNKQRIISNGSGADVVYLEPLDSTQNQTLKKELHFYGIFDENQIMTGMNMTYSYTAWAPWNRDLQSDSLAVRLKKIILNQYKGNDFITVTFPDIRYPVFVKIDGNRQIIIYPKNGKDVAVKIEDLRSKLKDKK